MKTEKMIDRYNTIKANDIYVHVERACVWVTQYKVCDYVANTLKWGARKSVAATFGAGTGVMIAMDLGACGVLGAVDKVKELKVKKSEKKEAEKIKKIEEPEKELTEAVEA